MYVAVEASHMLTPQKAADVAGVSRKTIMDAIKAQKLYATRDNRNRWQIEDDELKKWMANREPRKAPATTTEVSLEVSVLSARLVSAERETAFYRDQLNKSEAEKAALVDVLKEAQRRRSLWEMIVGR